MSDSRNTKTAVAKHWFNKNRVVVAKVLQNVPRVKWVATEKWPLFLGCTLGLLFVAILENGGVEIASLRGRYRSTTSFST